MKTVTETMTDAAFSHFHRTSWRTRDDVRAALEAALAAGALVPKDKVDAEVNEHVRGIVEMVLRCYNQAGDVRKLCAKLLKDYA